LTEEHVKLIRGLVGATGRAVLVFDSDEAGMKAAKRSVPLFEKGMVEARVLVLPPGHDPDSYVRTEGPAAFQILSQRAQAVVPFLADMAIAQFGLALEGRIRVLTELAQPLAAITDPGARAVYVKYLAERLDIDESAVLEKVAQFNARPAGRMTEGLRSVEPQPQRQGSLVPKSSRIRVELALVAMMLQYPPILPAIRKHRVIEALEDPLLRTIARETLGESPPVNGASDDPEAKARIVAQLTARREQWDPKRCRDIIRQLLAPVIRRRASQLAKRIKAAEAADNQTLVDELFNESKRLAEMRRDLQIRVGSQERS
jgi:DNA primase